MVEAGIIKSSMNSGSSSSGLEIMETLSKTVSGRVVDTSN